MERGRGIRRVIGRGRVEGLDRGRGVRVLRGRGRGRLVVEEDVEER